MRTFIFLILACVMLVGCASLKETIKGINADAAGYTQEAAQAASGVKDAIPELPSILCIAIGYAAAFIRRWYKNIKKEQANKNGD